MPIGPPPVAEPAVVAAVPTVVERRVPVREATSVAPLVSRRAPISRTTPEPNVIRGGRSAPVNDEEMLELPTISPVAAPHRPVAPMPALLPEPEPPAMPAFERQIPTVPTMPIAPGIQAPSTQHVPSPDPGSLDRLAGQLYDRVRGQLSAELLVGRERSQLLTDLT